MGTMFCFNKDLAGIGLQQADEVLSRMLLPPAIRHVTNFDARGLALLDAERDAVRTGEMGQKCFLIRTS